MRCKYALISFTTNKFDIEKDLYIIIGEIYIELSFSILESFHKNLKYLYPFRCEIINNKTICYNIEDILIFSKLYNLTISFSIKNNVTNRTNFIFNTPCLYDISCGVPLFNYIENRISIQRKINSDTMFIVVMPILNPIERGKALEEIILMFKNKSISLSFILVSKKYKSNRDNIAELENRFLQLCNVDKKRIFITDLDMYNILKQLYGNIIVVCSKEEISSINSEIRILRKSKLINCKARYVC